MKRFAPANVLTLLRCLLSLSLFAFEPLGKLFLLHYTLAGLSDMVDGPVARRTHTESSFGATFDSLADLLFVGVSLFRILPVLVLPKFLLHWVVAIAVLRLAVLVYGFVSCGRFIMLHTLLDKVTGFLCFLLPLSFLCGAVVIGGSVVSSVATFAAIEEGILVRKEGNKRK